MLGINDLLRLAGVRYIVATTRLKIQQTKRLTYNNSMSLNA